MERWETNNLERLKKAVGETALPLLNADQLRTLEWLAGWDNQTIENVCSIINLLRRK